MKLPTYAFLAAALACGFASATTTAYTTPVGYETLTLKAGINYSGLRLQQSVVTAGVLSGVASHTVTDSTQTFALTTGTEYIVEFNESGYVQIINGSAAVGSVITTPDDLTGHVAVGSHYKIRPCATLASTFGAVPATLAQGFGGPAGADMLYIPDAAGVLKVYFYDQFGTDGTDFGWFISNPDQTLTKVADPTKIAMPYDNGLVFGAAADTTLTVTGEVKTGATMLAVAAGINYVGSVYPAGATLASTFGAVPAGLAQGFGGPAGADMLYIPDAAGVLKVYFYDQFGTDGTDFGWFISNPDQTLTKVADPTTISMASGYVFGAAAASNVLATPPTSYSGL